MKVAALYIDPRGPYPNGELLRASAEQRRRTPVAFAQWLIELARQAGTSREAAE